MCFQKCPFTYPALGVVEVAMHSDHLDLEELEVCEDTRRNWRNNGRNRENRARKDLRAAKENHMYQ